MDYNVEVGKDRATIEIAQETKVVFPFTFNVVAVKATSGSVTVSLSAGAQSGDDGSDTIGEGDSTVFSQLTAKEIYISGSGTIKVWAGVRPEFCPFKKSAKGGGSGSGTAYKGTTTTALSNGSTTNPITIDGESYTAVFGDIVVYNYTEFIFDGTQWSEFGRPFDSVPTMGSANAVTSDGIYRNTAGRKYFVNGVAKGEAFNHFNNKASGNGSHAEGYNTTASQDYTHAEGYNTTASGYYCHAEGSSSTATGNFSHSEGHLATASGHESHAEGERTTASGTASHAGGCYTIANKYASTAIGKYNVADTDVAHLLIVGNGTENARSNILEVSNNDMNVNGDIKMNGIAFPTLYTTMPAVTVAMVGKMALYVGETGGGYVQGCFYVAVSDGAAEPSYSWKRAGDDGGGLPSEYEELPYIQQNGYVGFPLLNYISSNGDIIECETARTNSTGSARFVNFNDNSTFLYDTNGTLLRTIGGYFTDLIGDRQWEVGARYVSKAQITRDGGKINSIGSYNNGYAFALKWYYVKIYRTIFNQAGETANTVLLHSLIPCRRKADDKVGMYDLKYNIFYVSTTGTDFTA